MAISKITSKSIADGTVVGADITPGTVTNAKISPSAAIANAKLQNSAITINGASTSLGGSATVNTATEWQALTVADGSTQLTATAGKGYFLDTNAGVIEVFLPTSPSRGDRIVLADYSGTFATNQCIINTGGKLIDSTTGPEFKLTTNNTIAELIYVDANKGWLVYLNQAAGTTPSSVLTDGIYDQDTSYIAATGGTVATSGNFKIHTFTGDGCFVVSDGVGPLASADYMVVAGGGGGGKSGGGEPNKFRGGGGGAGGYRSSGFGPSPLRGTALTLSPGTYPISVGAGGAGFPAPTGSAQGDGSNGSNSIFSTITSAGGGFGAMGPGGPGGSGGGGSGNEPSGSAGGSGNTPPVSPPQGNNGGTGGAPDASGGGGGGAGAVGANGPTSPTGNAAGGAGVPNTITGSDVTYAAGGAGGQTPDTAGSANTGNGGNSGGSEGGPPGNAGGKGIVVIKYQFQSS